MAATRSGGRGPYAKTALVRQRIVEAATEVFAESGYWATTMKAIALRAGISQRGLVHHFADKEHLLHAVIELRDIASAELMAPVGQPVNAFSSMLAVVFDNIGRPGLVELYTVLTAEAASAEHPAHDHYRTRFVMLRRYFSLAFEALREQGELHSSLNSDALAAQFIALVDGLQLQWLYDGEAIEIASILNAFLASVIPRFTALSAGEAGA